MRLSTVTCMDTCRPSTFLWSRNTHVGAFLIPLNTVSFLLNVPSPESEITLAKLVVLFQGRDSQIFDSRVRYFTLPAFCTVVSPTAFLTHLFQREREGWLRIPFICGRDSAVVRAVSSTRISEGTRH
ncbi:hypothetical protein TcCL_NonESM09851 [Trypanosoma cruzi]|nr:hypothetical protein TcCL_NonESM09851 [Trypanosoma cruzi]